MDLRKRLGRGLAARAAEVLSINTTAIVAFLLFALQLLVPLAYALAALLVVASLRTGRKRAAGAYAGARALVLCGLIVVYARRVPQPNLALLVAGLLVLGLTLHEQTVRRVSAAAPIAANLDGFSLPPPAPKAGRRVFLVNITLTVAFGIGAALTAPTWLVLIVAAAAVIVTGAVVVDAAKRRLARRARPEQIRERLEQYSPTFLVYFSGPGGSDYQVKMWLPYFDRLGQRYAVILRERHSLRSIASATSAPVLTCTTIAAVDNAMVSSLRAVFYVNNGMKNTHSVRFGHLTHVQLLHGDSDKPPSYSPVTAMYDKVFVAGQAGIERYAKHGVVIPRQKFEIVGRPQVESISVVARPVSTVAHPTVLYAPTWKGHYVDSNFCSLSVAEELLRTLLKRPVTVILRPHPYSLKDPESAAQVARLEQLLAADHTATGRRHLWGTAASTDMTLFEAFNLSDALLTDVSSVASDYLYSQKPIAVTDMLDEGDEFANMFPLGVASYILRRDASNAHEIFDAMLGADPLARIRAEMRTFYLGPFPPEHYAEGFLSAARLVATTPKAIAGQQGHHLTAEADEASTSSADVDEAFEENAVTSDLD